MRFIHNLVEPKTGRAVITGEGRYPVDTSDNSWERGRSEGRAGGVRPIRDKTASHSEDETDTMSRMETS